MSRPTSRSAAHLLYLVIIALLLLVVAAQGTAAAPTPQAGSGPAYITYQGTLRSPEGQPLTGAYELTLAIYDGPQPGAALLWSDTFANVAARDGQFAVLLGSGKPFDNVGIFRRQDLYLGVTVKGFSEMTPRQRFSAVPSALYAAQANAADTAAALVADGNVTVRHEGGNVTVNPYGSLQWLHVRGNKILLSKDNREISMRLDGAASDLTATGADLHIRSPGHTTFVNAFPEDGDVQIGRGLSVRQDGNVYVGQGLSVGGELQVNQRLWTPYQNQAFDLILIKREQGILNHQKSLP